MSISTINTSLNQVPALFKKYTFPKDSKIVNYGCGRYPDNIAELYPNVVSYDPLYDNGHKQTSEVYTDVVNIFKYIDENDNVILMCANVLCVLTDEQLYETLDYFSIMQQLGCIIYISIYEGDKSSIQKQTTKGYQRNEPIKNYLDYINFGNVELKGKTIIIS